MRTKILIIEDDVVDLELVQRSLKISDVDIIKAGTVKESLELIQSNSDVDCIILDYYLPDSSGTHCIEEIRAKLAFVPIIVITGRGDEMLVASIFKAGTTDYIAKSKLTSEVLTEMTVNVIKKHRNELKVLLANLDALQKMEINITRKIEESRKN